MHMTYSYFRNHFYVKDIYFISKNLVYDKRKNVYVKNPIRKFKGFPKRKNTFFKGIFKF